MYHPKFDFSFRPLQKDQVKIHRYATEWWGQRDLLGMAFSLCESKSPHLAEPFECADMSAHSLPGDMSPGSKAASYHDAGESRKFLPDGA